MSRAININLSEAAVAAMCVKHSAAVSAIEALPDGATRVVLVTADGADLIRKACRTKLLPDRTQRFPLWDSRR